MSNLIEHTYDVKLEWSEGKIGTLRSDDLDDSFEVATPPEFPGGIEGIWSPEHLFVASVSSCFMTTFTAIAEKSNLDFNKLSVPATGKLSNESGKFLITEVILRPTLVITEEAQKDKAHRILEKAEKFCLISSSINSKVILEPEVLIAESV
jgi:peroxiredoxin-like protein